MTGVSIDSLEERVSSGDEAGTAPGDRRFRPDVEGLRAVAIVLVVLYHGGLKALSGGYVGVDVFFVISGFVITGLLLRERSSSQRTSFLNFYGRRSRRIIPAATLVIVVTVVASYVVLGVLYGNSTAVDARWTALFLANFHFASTGTNYLTAQTPPSPLLNFWSLAVEEQFYLVYPAFFAVVAATFTRFSFRIRLALGLSAVILISLGISVTQTNSSPTATYFSPFARAWELALGALVAVGTPWLLSLPRRLMGAVTWVGLVAIGFSAVAFNASTTYPGTAVVVPVVGAALVIAGGVHASRWAAESILGVRPFRWMGRLSYSLYLWHWPILILAADSADKSSLPFRQNVIWLVIALAASIVTYRVVENPIRHARTLTRGWPPVALGALLIALSLVVASVELAGHSSASDTPQPKTIVPSSLSQVEQLVRAAPNIRALPKNLAPSLGSLVSNWGGPPHICTPAFPDTTLRHVCVLGDPTGTKTMVLYGDSHVHMWFDALNSLAKEAHWRLIDLGKNACPVEALPVENPVIWGKPGAEYVACNQWHTFAVNQINLLKPDLLIVSQEPELKVGGRGSYTRSQWQQGLEAGLRQITIPKSRIVILGNIPLLPQDPPVCLAQNATNIQTCSGSLHTMYTSYNEAENAAAAQSDIRYINVEPWFCSNVCTAVVGRYRVFYNQYHVSADYSLVLADVLWNALGLPPVGRVAITPPP